MEKRIIPIALVVLASVMMLNYDFIIKPAYAQTFQVISGLSHQVKAIHYQVENDLIWILTGNNTDSRTVLYWVDRSTLSVVGSFNHTTSVNGGVGNKAQDIWCGKTDCFITTASQASNGVNGQILKISTEDISPNIFRGKNVTGTYTHTETMYHITGRDEVTAGFGSITLWVNVCANNSVNCEDEIHIIDGISMTYTQDLVDFGINNNLFRVHEMRWSGIAGGTDNDLVFTHGANIPNTSDAKLRVINLATLLAKCSVDTPVIGVQASLPLGVATNYFGAGNVNNKIYVGTNSGHLFVYDDNCTLLQTVNSTETGLSNDVRYVEASSSRIFMQESGANGIISQMLLNSTGHVVETDNTTYFPLPAVSQTTYDSQFVQVTHGNMILFSGFNKLWYTYTGNDKRVGILTYDTTPEDDPTGSGCDDPANANKLICRLGGNETSDLGRLIGDGILDLGCEVVFVDCTDDNPQTNGLGLLVFIASIFVIIGMFYWSIGREAFHIPIFIWIVIIIALSAFFTITGIIDPIFLIISIIAVIALASPKIIGIVRGGNTFGGGSSA